ncbi:50S ribosomal protein L6 [Candidatus Phytoplasma pruni]|uniref:Large ribosomal subunit protein uL6 n=1 Tax=Candidatus Phytoplasma pruni TaxID=479893 RepID=A0A851HCP8_9MOLU|nr:50S ribosomal protein L6 [Candidatus Phytoplasma pruni]NWN45845.1 50S ribosomal protein L6 [Candidatus Phytoplasma pruni]
MSRVGNKVITVPKGVEVDIQDNNFITVKSSKGQLEYQFNPSLKIDYKDNLISVKRPNDEIFMKKIHGTTRALLNNMITGLDQFFVKKMEIVGLGYNVQKKDSTLTFNLGFSHPIVMNIPAGLEVEIVKSTEITVKGVDKQFVGEFAAKIAKLSKPEPYKGKGIRYVGQYIHRKAGKSAKK